MNERQCGCLAAGWDQPTTSGNELQSDISVYKFDSISDYILSLDSISDINCLVLFGESEWKTYLPFIMVVSLSPEQ